MCTAQDGCIARTGSSYSGARTTYTNSKDRDEIYKEGRRQSGRDAAQCYSTERDEREKLETGNERINKAASKTHSSLRWVSACIGFHVHH